MTQSNYTDPLYRIQCHTADEGSRNEHGDTWAPFIWTHEILLTCHESEQLTFLSTGRCANILWWTLESSQSLELLPMVLTVIRCIMELISTTATLVLTVGVERQWYLTCINNLNNLTGPDSHDCHCLTFWIFSEYPSDTWRTIEWCMTNNYRDDMRTST